MRKKTTRTQCIVGLVSQGNKWVHGFGLNGHPPFLSNVLRDHTNSPPTHRSHVALTVAQSLDAKIAGPGGHQLILSGNDSMVMTHW
jgi:hypothetical protein